MNQLQRTTLGFVIGFPSTSQPSSTTLATVSFCSGFQDFSSPVTSTSSLLTFVPTFKSIFLILNFYRVLKKSRLVLSNPSMRSIECSSVQSCFVLVRWLLRPMRVPANYLMIAVLLASLFFLASIHTCSAFLKSSVSLTLFSCSKLFFLLVSCSFCLT